MNLSQFLKLAVEMIAKWFAFVYFIFLFPHQYSLPLHLLIILTKLHIKEISLVYLIHHYCIELTVSQNIHLSHNKYKIFKF